MGFQLLDTVIAKVQTTASAESMVFYLKMKGDYYRYLGEFESDGPKRQEIAASAASTYEQGLKQAEALESCNPVRLGIALNCSVFQHEVLRETQKAVDTATVAFNTAAAEIENFSPERKQDSMLTIQLLQENLML